MEPTELSPPTDGRRAWLAALLLRQPDRFLPRLTATLTRWRATPRDVYKRQRQQHPRRPRQVFLVAQHHQNAAA